MVHVEVMRLGALEQHDLAGIEGGVQDAGDVGHHRTQPLGVREQGVGHLSGVDGAAVVHLHQQMVLLLQRGFDLLAQDLLVEQILHPNAQAVDLVGVGRADTASGGADAAVAEEPLSDLVDHLVIRGDDVRVGADDELGGVHAAGVESVDLLEQDVQIDHHAVGDHRHRVVQNSRRQQVQRVLLAVHDQGVAGVVPAGVADGVVDPVTELVGRLPLALVAPLRADDHDSRHVAAPLREESPRQCRRALASLL